MLDRTIRQDWTATAIYPKNMESTYVELGLQRR